jgi:hypothetical protein
MSETEAKCIVFGYQQTFDLPDFDSAMQAMIRESFEGGLFPIERVAVEKLNKPPYKLSVLLY